MILVDANLLVYSWNSSAPQHAAARAWLEGRLTGIERVGLPWVSLLAFVRLVSNPRIFEQAAPVDQAWSQVAEWLARPNVFSPEPTDRHRQLLERMMPEAGRADLIPDVHLAALAIEYGLTLQTTDRDFARFSGLVWENPLERD